MTKRLTLLAALLFASGAFAQSSTVGSLKVGTNASQTFKVFIKQARTTKGIAIEAPSTSDQLRLYADGTNVVFESSGDPFQFLGSDELRLSGTSPFHAWYEGATRRAYVQYDSGGNDFFSFVAENATAAIRFYTNNTEWVRIASSGNVAIGNTLASSRLHVGAGGTGTNGEELRIDSGSGAGGYASLGLYRNSVFKGSFTVAGAANQSITGSAAGDLAIASVQAILLSTDSGATLHAKIDATALDAITGLKIGTGTEILKHLSATGSLDFGAVAANACAELTVTVTGAADGDTVSIGVPNALSSTAGLSFTGFVSATNTVTVRACNVATAAAADPAAATVRADVWVH